MSNENESAGEAKSGESKSEVFKIPQAKQLRRLNFVLLIGLLVLAAGIVLVGTLLNPPGSKVSIIAPLVLFGCAVIFLFFAFAMTGNFVLTFLGIFTFLSGVLTLLVNLKIIPVGYSKLWPMFSVFFGLSLIPAGLYKLKRIRTVYFFPAMMLILLGGFLQPVMLGAFNLDYAKLVPFVVAGLLILGGIVLVAVYFMQKKKIGKLPILKDDSLDDGNFESPIDKLYGDDD